MKSNEVDHVTPPEIDELDILKHRLDSEFQRTIFRIISLILTWLIGIFSIYMLIDVEPLVNQVGIPSSILFILLFPILLIIAWGAADHQRRVDSNESIRETHHERVESDVDQIINNVSNDPLAKEVSSSELWRSLQKLCCPNFLSEQSSRIASGWGDDGSGTVFEQPSRTAN